MSRFEALGNGRRMGAAAAAAIVFAMLPLAAGSPSAASRVIALRPSVSIGLDQPTAITVDKSHLFIVNAGNDSVTELTESGVVVRTISGSAYEFASPVAIAGDGTDLFVVNSGGSVTEFAESNGDLVQVISGAGYDFDDPTALVVHSGSVFVVNSDGNSVTQLSDSTGALVQVISNVSNPSYQFDDPNAIADMSGDIWVTNATGGSTSDPLAGSVTEFKASTGGFVRLVEATADGLETPDGIAFDGSHLWVSDNASNQVTELSQSGKLVQVVTNSSNNANYGFDKPTVVVAYKHEVYVDSPPGSSPMVTQVDSSTTDGNWFECDTNVPDPDFVYPTGIAVSGSDVRVVSPSDNTLTELDSTDSGTAINWFT